MHDHGDFVTLFSAYWWLIFPVGWGISQLFHSWQRQRKAEKAMEIIKGYADQGKEPPPEVLKMLQAPERSTDPVSVQNRERDRARGLMLTSMIFVALAISFGVLMTFKLDPDGDDHAGLLFVTVLMAGFAVAFFISAVVLFRDYKRKNSP